MSLDFKEIEKLIFKGADDAYFKNLTYSYEFTDYTTRMIEYICTINVADSLSEYTRINNLKLHMEYPIKDFYNGAFPDFVKGKFGKQKRDHNPKSNKSGRVDIVITKDSEDGRYFLGTPHYKKTIKSHNKKTATPYGSLIGIEVKSINRQVRLIRSDIQRMSEAMIEEDSIGENGIKKCYVLFFRKLGSSENLNSKQKLKNALTKDKTKWENEINKFKNNYKGLKFEIESKTLYNTSDEETKKEYPPEFFDYGEVADKTGIIISYLIKINK